MTDTPTKKLLKKIDKKIPGFSYFFDPKKIFDLKENENDLLELASSFLLMADKVSKTKVRYRKQFSKLIKQKMLIRQNFRCASCGEFLEYPEFHHKDGNSSNNYISNCEVLCPNCHRKKHRKSRS